MDEAGTLQCVVRIKARRAPGRSRFTTATRIRKAPRDRARHKNPCRRRGAERHIKERQRGAAWLHEGIGAESDRLGADREHTVIQAKQICETLAL
jgi:hypothetical protein